VPATFFQKLIDSWPPWDHFAGSSLLRRGFIRRDIREVSRCNLRKEQLTSPQETPHLGNTMERKVVKRVLSVVLTRTGQPHVGYGSEVVNSVKIDENSATFKK